MNDSYYSSVSSTSSSSSKTKTIKSLDTISPGSTNSTNSEPFFFLFGEDPNDGDCFYLNMKFDSKDVRKGAYISLSFYLFEKDLPPMGQHGSERPEDFIDKDVQSQLSWEYAHSEVVRDNRDRISTNGIDGKKDNVEQSIREKADTFENASAERKIIWSPLNDRRYHTLI